MITRDRWLGMSRADKARFCLLMVVKTTILPLQVIFYLIRSAWIDSDSVGWWLAPSCKHGQRPNDRCLKCEEEWMKSQLDQLMKHPNAREN